MKKFAIIVAGGSGTRMKSGVPKQFLLLNGKPVLFHTLFRFHQYDPSLIIILVLPEKLFPYWKELCNKYKFHVPHTIVAGGRERFFSVKNGLNLVTEKSIIAIHDGVRPLVSNQTIYNCFSTAKKMGTAVPVVPLTESLRHWKKNGSVAVNRAEYFLVQTPQCFRSEVLINAYNQKFLKEFTDDAGVVERSGKKIHLVEGNPENIKITTDRDLKLAEIIATQLI